MFGRRFELTCVQRNLKALGTFGFMATVRGNEVYLPYVPSRFEDFILKGRHIRADVHDWLAARTEALR